MTKPVEIVETKGRTAEGAGVSRPYICTGADENLYFVKTRDMGPSAMIKDWLFSSAAARMGLPVARATIVNIPPALSEGQQQLPPGLAYGSREVKNAMPCLTALADQTEPLIASRVLLFDYWCQNEDRIFSLFGGNPNLLYLPTDSQIVMIDHDNALDPDFNRERFWQRHGLAGRIEMFMPGMRREAESWLAEGCAAVESLWAELPDEWLLSTAGDPFTALALPSILEILKSNKTDEEFWRLP